MPDAFDRPPIARAALDVHARRAAAALRSDPDEVAALKAAAVAIAPLQELQAALDQLAARAEDRRKGLPWPFDTPYRRFVGDMLAHAGHFRDVLKVAAEAADSMISHMSSQVQSLETTMSAENRDEPPRLTVSGEPHPLQEGGYDPTADPQKPGNISDIEALKEGKATQAQAEALGRADLADSAERSAGQEPQGPGPGPTPAEAEAGAPPAAAPAATDFAPPDDDDPARGPGAYSPEPKRGRKR